MEENGVSWVQAILQRHFEERTQEQQDLVVHLLYRMLGRYSMDQCRWLSLLCKHFPNHQSFAFLPFQAQSLVIFPSGQHFSTLVLNSQNDLSQLPTQGFLIFLSKRSINNCLSLAGQTIEQMVKVLHGFDYLSEIPRRRLYHVLRNMDVLHFSFNQVVYLQNQLISSESYVYIVRKGEFTFLKREKSTHKNVQLYTFFEGYLFGTEEEEPEGEQGTVKMKEKRAFTVRCQRSEGIVYRIKIDFFNAFLRKSCEHLLRNNGHKLNRFFEERFLQAEMSLTRNAQFITQPFKRSLSVQLNYPVQPFKKPDTLNDKHEQGKKPSLPMLNIKAEFSSRKKLLSKEQINRHIPEYQEQKLILLKQYKCQKVRESIKEVCAPCKSEVLLGLMKTTFSFDKIKSRKYIP